MQIKKIQNLCFKIVQDIDSQYDIQRNPQLTLSQLVEELGELARLVNYQKLRSKQPQAKELRDEVADVFIQFCALVSAFDIDIQTSVLEKFDILKKRHNLK